MAYIYKKITGWILYKMHRELRVKEGVGRGGGCGYLQEGKIK